MSAATLEFIDLGAPPKLGLKGPAANAWMTSQGVDVPADVFAANCTDDGGWIVRLGATEFMVESGRDETLVERLAAALSNSPAGVYRVPREDATFLLAGPKSRSVLSQTCGIDFRSVPPQRLIYTRVAGVSCAILPEVGVFRIWVDPSYAAYLWETLAMIVEELGGHTKGAEPARNP
jgi:sarcosine oxidase subunit gamma